jgi:hypothetical protein
MNLTPFLPPENEPDPFSAKQISISPSQYQHLGIGVVYAASEMGQIHFSPLRK